MTFPLTPALSRDGERGRKQRQENEKTLYYETEINSAVEPAGVSARTAAVGCAAGGRDRAAERGQVHPVQPDPGDQERYCG